MKKLIIYYETKYSKQFSGTIIIVRAFSSLLSFMKERWSHLNQFIEHIHNKYHLSEQFTMLFTFIWKFFTVTSYVVWFKVIIKLKFHLTIDANWNQIKYSSTLITSLISDKLETLLTIEFISHSKLDHHSKPRSTASSTWAKQIKYYNLNTENWNTFKHG